MGFRALALDSRQGAHEAVIAAIGFEIAVDEGDNLVLRGEGDARLVQADLGAGGWRNHARVDAVESDIDLFPQARRLDQHGKLLLMAPGKDRSGRIGFRCVVDAA